MSHDSDIDLSYTNLSLLNDNDIVSIIDEAYDYGIYKVFENNITESKKHEYLNTVSLALVLLCTSKIEMAKNNSELSK
jgi:hypothetical protein